MLAVDMLMELAYSVAQDNELEYEVVFSKDFKYIEVTFTNLVNTKRSSWSVSVNFLQNYYLYSTFEDNVRESLKNAAGKVLQQEAP